MTHDASILFLNDVRGPFALSCAPASSCLHVSRRAPLLLRVLLLLTALSLSISGIASGQDDNVLCVPDPLCLSDHEPTGDVAVRYLGGASGLVYAYDVSFSWDPTVVSCLEVIEGTLLSNEGETWFIATATGPNEISVQCSLLGQADGASGPGDLFTIALALVDSGTSPLDLTLNHFRDRDNNELSGFAERDGHVVLNGTGDLYISEILPIQVTTHANSLVTHKRTVVRATVFSSFPCPRSAMFEIAYDYGTAIAIESGPGGTGVTLTPDIPNYVYVPGGPVLHADQLCEEPWDIGSELIWTSPGTDSQLSVTIDPNHLISETNETNNTVVLTPPVPFHDSRTLDIGFMRVQSVWPWTYGVPDPLDFQETIAWSSRFINTVYPIKDNGVMPSNHGTMLGTVGLYGPTVLMQDLIRLDLLGALVGVDRMVGITTLPYFADHSVAGLAGMTNAHNTSSLAAVHYWTAPAHEILHNLPPSDNWRYGDDEEYKQWLCEDSWERCDDDEDCSLPGEHCYHVNGRPADGFLMMNHSVITPGVTSTDAHCFMGNTTPRPFDPGAEQRYLVCDECYDHLLPVLTVQRHLRAETIIFVSGIIHNDQTAELYNMYVLENRIAQYPDSGVGSYAITMVDSSENVLEEILFDVDFRLSSDEGWIETESDGFAFEIPYPDMRDGELAGVRLMNESDVLAEQVVSENAPTVTVLYPNGGESLELGGEHEILWEGTDVDGDSLSYTAFLTPDNGVTWEILALESQSMAYMWDTSESDPSDSCRIRVVVTDGIKGGIDASDEVFQLVDLGAVDEWPDVSGDCLSHESPNPFNDDVRISYSTPVDCHVKLGVHNVLGQTVAKLVDEQQTAGSRTVMWNAGAVPSGIYWYRLEAGDITQTRKLVLIK